MTRSSTGSSGHDEGSSSPTGDAPLRRERVVEVLIEAFARDQFGTEELERRLDRANRVHTEAELRELLSDLDLPALEGPPPVPAEARSSPAAPVERHPTPHGQSLPARVERASVPERQLNVGIWSGRTRAGRWVPARNVTALAVMGGVDLDFREASFGPDPVELWAVSVMGGIHMIVPPELKVETSGFAIMGAFEDHAEMSTAASAGAPVLRVRGAALMGGVSIEVRRVGESARDAKRRRKREERGDV